MKHGEKPPVRVFLPRFAVLLLASLLLSPIPSRAADLMEVYRLAREQDRPSPRRAIRSKPCNSGFPRRRTARINQRRL
jgi:hypothetical protein